MVWRSEWQTPQNNIFTVTSLSPFSLQICNTKTKTCYTSSSITTSKTWICLSLSLQMGEKKSNKPSREMKWRKNTRFVVSRPSKCFVLIGRFRHILFRLSVGLSLWAIDFLLFFFCLNKEAAWGIYGGHLIHFCFHQ